jgi:hypothetical protein
VVALAGNSDRTDDDRELPAEIGGDCCLRVDGGRQCPVPRKGCCGVAHMESMVAENEMV